MTRMQQPEPQRAGDWRRFDQFDRHWIPEPIRCRIAGEGVRRVIVAEIFIADVARRYQTVGAGLVEFDE